MSHNLIQRIRVGDLDNLTMMLFLHLGYNNIDHIAPFSLKHLVMLRVIILEGNQIYNIRENSFNGLQSLPTLILANLSINRVAPRAFHGLLSLQYLDLSSNELTELGLETFDVTAPVSLIGMSYNQIQDFDPLVFSKLSALDLISVDFSHLCCLIPPRVRCLFRSDTTDMLTSCRDLLTTHTLRALTWSLSACIFLCNAVVICYRLKEVFNSCGINAMSILFLAVADEFVGVYLVVLASVDVHYRNSFHYGKGTLDIQCLVFNNRQFSLHVLGNIAVHIVCTFCSTVLFIPFSFRAPTCKVYNICCRPTGDLPHLVCLWVCAFSLH